MSTDNSEDPKIGYRKPPARARFKPGTSGNRHGRPKGALNFATDVKDALRTPITVNDQGKTRKVSTQKAALMRLREKALKGDARSLDRLLELARLYQPVTTAADADDVLAADQAMLDHYRERILADERMASPNASAVSYSEGDEK